MKKIFSFLVIIVLTLCLVGCGDVTKKTTTDDPTIKIWTDEETGVQYVVYSAEGLYSGMGGITPRLNADGTLYGIENGGAKR